MKKIPGTTSTPFTKWEEIERYARHLADAPSTSGELALRLLEMAVADVRRVAGIPVTVFAHDGRTAYVGLALRPKPTGGRYDVYNPETSETNAVPIGSVAPYGAHLDCDCPSCLDTWVGSGLG